MRQQKSKKMLYIFILLIIAAIGFIVTRDVTVNIEHAEEIIDISDLKN